MPVCLRDTIDLSHSAGDAILKKVEALYTRVSGTMLTKRVRFGLQHSP